MNHHWFKQIISRLIRNQTTLVDDGRFAKHNRINLEWWNRKINVGDQLSPVIYKWMLEQKQLDPNKKMKKTKHIYGLGSVLGIRRFDAVIWGSGIARPEQICNMYARRNYIKYDIRALRGPITKQYLQFSGYDCSECVLGDPAILLPFIYDSNPAKKYEQSVVFHADNHCLDKAKDQPYHSIEVGHTNWKLFVDEIRASQKVISSSLHGIIVAETYGVPAVFLNDGSMDEEIIKYYDWYYSTGRRSVRCASSLQEALEMEPMELPQLESMQQDLLNTFPYDLWN